MSLGPYTSFITTSYALVALVVLLLIVWIVVDYRTQQARLRELVACARVEAHEKNPEAAIPWEDFDARLKRRLGE